MDQEQAKAKSRILAKGRKIDRDIERYATHGYVTELADYEDDDRKLTRAVDGLYDSARRAGIHDDPELMAARERLHAARVAARERANQARRELRQAQSAAVDKRIADARSTARGSGMQGYLDELSIADAKRRARRR